VSGELGKASLDLEANLEPFVRNLKIGRAESGEMAGALDRVAAISKLAEEALQRVKMKPGQGAESSTAADVIERSVGRVGRTALSAADHLEKVKLTAEQAARSDVAGDVIDRKLRGITGNANEARRALESVHLAGVGAGGRVPVDTGRGVGPFGSGFGRIGLLGTAVGAGVLTVPAAAPAAAGLLAALPTLAASGVGAVGTLALAFQGVGKAIGGDLKAFKELEPAQQRFVLTVRSLDGALDKLKQTAGQNLFPGLTEGLRSALSPGTVGAITKAVTEFARAIGQAGAQWGRYFGSAQFQNLFGPLMQAGARNLTILSSTVLHLFDALGVLGRAAIPFTNWLLTASDRGAKLASSWLRAKDASGGLAHAMSEAQTSLRLVGGLFVALGRAVASLGTALYPVSKVAVKDLTNGLNALAGIIRRNQQAIREIVGGALAAFVQLVKAAAAAIRVLWPLISRVTSGLGGWRRVFEILIGLKIASLVTGWAASFTKLAGAEALGGAEAKSAGLLGNLRKLAAIRVIGIPIVLDVALAGAGAVALTKLMGWAGTGISRSFGGSPNPGTDRPITKSGYPKSGYPPLSTWTDDEKAAFAAQHGRQTADWYRHHKDEELRVIKRELAAADRATGGAGAINRSAGFGGGLDTPPTTKPESNVFTKPPLFDKNVPTAKAPPLIPPAASHAEALASANASRAQALGNIGQTAKRYLEAELADLETADKLIKAKYSTAIGQARTRLFASLTHVENQIRTVRARMHKAIVDGRAAELKFAVDQAKNAVASATEGTPAYDKAVKAEEKALRKEIAYLHARETNRKLSLKEREKAIHAEIADKKELARLTKPLAGSTAANEKQFLSSFKQIVSEFAPNAFPVPGSGGKTDTHLYDMKHELRQQTSLLRRVVRDGSFPGSDYAVASAGAAAG
jgi:hypothetical protein